jgi:hypothetical protein
MIIERGNDAKRSIVKGTKMLNHISLSWYIAGLKRAESTETFEGDAVELVEWLKDCPINR